MDSEDELDMLTSLLAESEDVAEDRGGREQADDLDGLFDDDSNGGEVYKEGIEEEEEEKEEEQEEQPNGGTSDTALDLFGDVDDLEKEDQGKASKDDLQEELRRMKEQMQRLQQQLEASQNVSPPPPSPVRPAAPKRSSPKATPSRQPAPKLTQAKPTPDARRKQAASPAPGRRGNVKLEESSDFNEQLNNADAFKRKPRTAHQSKPSTPPENRGPLVEIKMGSSFLPVESSSKVYKPLLRSPPASNASPSPAASAGPKPPALPAQPKDVAVEKYSGLRLRKPRVSSTDMERRMADRRLIRLSQLPERLAREKLEESDWVTFGVLVNKATPQSSSSGKTFSVWKLNDLHNLDVFVSLLLFGEVHKEHWKTEPGSVIGLLNPNSMKQKEGYDGVSLTVDHPQKVLLMGEAQDFSTCKAAKKNGEPCSQIVNMVRPVELGPFMVRVVFIVMKAAYECQYCQYHVKAQYKQMSSKRVELQSAFSGKAPNRLKGKGNLKERLCQDGFYYGGVSSAACAASLTKSNKPTQKTLDTLFVKGAAQHVAQAKRLALQSGEISGCSTEFKSLLTAPTPGALQLKKHLVQGNRPVSSGGSGAPVQSISASDLLKQQKQKQKELLDKRRQRAAEIQKRVQQNSGGLRPGAASSSSSSLGGRGALMSPKAAPEVPGSPHAPTLGRGFSDGDDILFFDGSPPPPPAAASAPSLTAAKMAALRKLKGMRVEREDPNSVKRKRSNDEDISARVEKNRTSPTGESGNEDEEPAEKKKRDQLRYVQSEEFQRILNAKSRHDAVLQAAEYQLQERYFDPLVKKEQMEEKMKGIREMKCRAVTCKKCNYTYFKPADRCVEESHNLRWHDAVKRFFKCPCGQRAIALERLPNKHCSNCGLFKWERDGMLKEKTGPKIGGELLLPRGEEHGRFLSSMK